MQILPYCAAQALFLSVFQEVDFKIPLPPFPKGEKEEEMEPIDFVIARRALNAITCNLSRKPSCPSIT
jgi:hypothetical protein